jgi:hypothetical protein
MIYENGKWTVYTDQNNKFEMTEDDFRDIYYQFMEMDKRNHVFQDIFEPDMVDPSKYIETRHYGEYVEGLDERMYSYDDVISIVDDVFDGIQEDYIFVPRRNIHDEIDYNYGKPNDH